MTIEDIMLIIVAILGCDIALLAPKIEMKILCFCRWLFQKKGEETCALTG